MADHLAPLAYTLFMWWFSTVLILHLDGLPRHTFKWSLGAASVLAGVALCGLVATRDDTRITGAYLAFTAALMVWAWQEMAFLMGWLTGPRRSDCPPAARGLRRAGYALAAIAYHELALLAGGLLVLALSWGGTNLVGPATYGLLWVLRLSAKLNVFLGARNLNRDFLPEPVRHLGSYFRQRGMNRLFPWSLMLCAALTLLAWQQAVADATAPGFESAGWTFIASLATLGLVEHLLLMLPLSGEQLWRWGLRSRDEGAVSGKG